MASFMITREDGTSRDLRKANRRELAVITNGLIDQFAGLYRKYRTGFNPPKRESKRAEAELKEAYENCRVLRDYTRLHGLGQSEEVDQALAQYSTWLNLSFHKETVEVEVHDPPPTVTVSKPSSAAPSTVAMDSDLEGSIKGMGRKVISKLMPVAGPLMDLMRGRPKSTEPPRRVPSGAPARANSFTGTQEGNLVDGRGIFSPSTEKARGRMELLKRLGLSREVPTRGTTEQETVYYDATVDLPQPRHANRR